MAEISSDLYGMYGHETVAESVVAVRANICPRHILGLIANPEHDDPRDDPEMLRIAGELNRIAFGASPQHDMQHTSGDSDDTLLKAFPGSVFILE
jgi:hypothetical protein